PSPGRPPNRSSGTSVARHGGRDPDIRVVGAEYEWKSCFWEEPIAGKKASLDSALPRMCAVAPFSPPQRHAWLSFLDNRGLLLITSLISLARPPIWTAQPPTASASPAAAPVFPRPRWRPNWASSAAR